METSVTGADSVRIEEPADRQYARDAHIGIFFEGTGLNMLHEVFGVRFINLKPDDGYGKSGQYSATDITPEVLCDIEQRKGRSNGFTNVSMMYTLFTGENFEKKIPFAKIYVEGAGTTDDSSFINTKYGPGGLGFGQGETGVTALVSKAAVKVTECVNSWSDVDPDRTTLHFYVFGFSRGAACAMLFCHLLTRRAGSVLRCEDEFGKYRAKTMVRNGRLEFMEEYKKVENIAVDFLGLYDTVASIGLLRRKDGSLPIPIHDAEGKTFHYDNVYEYGLYTDSKIRNICHLCAMDEFRENFALVNVGRNVPGNAVEVMIPGCHSDVGGSYLDGSKSSVIKKCGKRCHRRKVSLNPYNEVPTDTAYVDLSSFEELGWVDGGCKVSEDDSQIKMCRPIRRGYSDIPLEMMIRYCAKMLEVELFNDVPVFHDFMLCGYPKLVNLGNNMVDKMEHLSKGGRYWLFPTNYAGLRMRYLHFSASDSVLPVNAPGYDEDDVMCRITYHGDNAAQRSAAEGVHFLYELSGTAMSIGFEGNPPSRSKSPYSVEYNRQPPTDRKTTRKIEIG